MEYNPANSAVYREWLQWQPHERSWDKWLVMALIGLSVGTTSFLLQQAIEILFSVREHLGRFFLDQQAAWGYLLAWIFYVALSAGAATGAALLVVKVAPAARASGVPEIMAFLNGVRVPGVLNIWTFVVKFWSCSLGVAAGLPIGPEGPLIHMGAILGAAMSGFHSTTLHFDLGWLRHLRASNHKRDFVTAGVAAGVAAAFDAPLGGLLFAFEEVASFWHSHLGWQVFFCCTMAVLTQVPAPSLGDRRVTLQYRIVVNDWVFPACAYRSGTHTCTLKSSITAYLLRSWHSTVCKVTQAFHCCMHAGVTGQPQSRAAPHWPLWLLQWQRHLQSRRRSVRPCAHHRACRRPGPHLRRVCRRVCASEPAGRALARARRAPNAAAAAA